MSKLPAAKRYETHILPDATSKDWFDATNAMIKGDREPLRIMLQGEDLPIRLADLFVLARKEAEQYEAILQADPAALTVQRLELELQVLERACPATVNDALEIVGKIEVNKSDIAFHRKANGECELAAHRLGSLRAVFPEIFGLERSKGSLANASLSFSNEIEQAMRSFGLQDGGKHWRDLANPVAEEPKRKIIARGI
jgi:hypothetical protein